MFPLLRLPVTIIQDVVELLCPHCHPSAPTRPEESWGRFCNNACSVGSLDLERRTALAHLCKTNKLLNAIATPLLYHFPRYNRHNLFPFIRTMFQGRLELAQYVKCFHIGEEVFYIEDFSAEETQLCRDFGVQIGLPITQTEPDSTTLFSSLILSKCTGVEELCMLSPYGDRDDVLFPDIDTLPNVKSVLISHHDTEFGFNLQDLNNVFSATPNVTSLSVFAMDGAGLALNLANLRRLRVMQSRLEAEDFALLMGQCPGLEWMSYQLGDVMVSYEEPASPREMQDSIVNHTPRLRYLELSMLDRSEYLQHDDYDETQMLQTLKELGQLEVLKLDLEYLIASLDDILRPTALVELLPTSIREVEITTIERKDREGLLEALGEVARSCKTDFPRLESVKCGASTLDEDQRQKAMDHFAPSGVRFSMLPPGPWD
ncbi:Putative leucine-rich repeat domain superfamily [Colletotrichum destructivum]|uniref:Leucine-rich repeat domain superfamily n=1 Tax=Colletotrichum destructivum TaxID=34406 RepID=A0AAX4I822_9PEZI|nr:Putative leucine-rich repeat domain superfamily [Colletotrichum destructivum]